MKNMEVVLSILMFSFVAFGNGPTYNFNFIQSAPKVDPVRPSAEPGAILDSPDKSGKVSYLNSSKWDFDGALIVRKLSSSGHRVEADSFKGFLLGMTHTWDDLIYLSPRLLLGSGFGMETEGGAIVKANDDFGIHLGVSGYFVRSKFLVPHECRVGWTKCPSETSETAWVRGFSLRTSSRFNISNFSVGMLFGAGLAWSQNIMSYFGPGLGYSTYGVEEDTTRYSTLEVGLQVSTQI